MSSIAGTLIAAATLTVLANPLAARPSAIAQLQSQQIALFDKNAASVVFIASGDGFGSGFYFGPPGIILTNRHVVGDDTTVDVVDHSGRRLLGKVVEKAAKADLALIKVDAKGPAMSLGRVSALQIGSFVASVGHGKGAIWTFNTGMVSNIYPSGSDEPVFQTQIPLNPGSSGGPIFDMHGQVVGIVTAGHTDANNLNFGIRIDVAVRMLEGLESLCDCVVFKAPAGIPIFLDGVMIGEGPRTTAPAIKGSHKAFVVIAGKMHEKIFVYPGQRRIEF